MIWDYNLALSFSKHTLYCIIFLQVSAALPKKWFRLWSTYLLTGTRSSESLELLLCSLFNHSDIKHITVTGHPVLHLKISACSRYYCADSWSTKLPTGTLSSRGKRFDPLFVRITVALLWGCFLANILCSDHAKTMQQQTKEQYREYYRGLDKV